MIPSTPSISPLRQRMLEDMRMRKLAAYLKRSPDAATEQDLRSFQRHLVDTGSSPMTLNATLTGLKFFFGHHSRTHRADGIRKHEHKLSSPAQATRSRSAIVEALLYVVQIKDPAGKP